MNSQLCSDCFKDEGLRISGLKMGIKSSLQCKRCTSTDGCKLSIAQAKKLFILFFQDGTRQHRDPAQPSLLRVRNKSSEQENYMIDMRSETKRDYALLSEILGLEIYQYGPPLWMIGINALTSEDGSYEYSSTIIQRILDSYPRATLPSKTKLYRIRLNPKDPSLDSEFDAPPPTIKNRSPGRFDTIMFPMTYLSDNVDICVQECQPNIDDEVYLATFKTLRSLKLLDLTTILDDGSSSYESLDTAVHQLFLQGEFAYPFLRKLAEKTKELGISGIVFPSRYSALHLGLNPVRTSFGLQSRRFSHFRNEEALKQVPNLVLFGRAIEDGLIEVLSINRVLLRQLIYDIEYGPALS